MKIKIIYRCALSRDKNLSWRLRALVPQTFGSLMNKIWRHLLTLQTRKVFLPMTWIVSEITLKSNLKITFDSKTFQNTQAEWVSIRNALKAVTFKFSKLESETKLLHCKSVIKKLQLQVYKIFIHKQLIDVQVLWVDRSMK